MVELPDDLKRARSAYLAAATHGTDMAARQAWDALCSLIAARVRAEAVAGERQRIAEALRQTFPAWAHDSGRGNPDQAGYFATLDRVADIVVAGSVPVATPPVESYRACAGCDGPELCRYCQYRVATPTEPDQDMLDDVDRLRSMWRESPGTRAYVEDRYPGLAHAIERAVMHEAASPVPAEQPDGWDEGTEAADHPGDCKCPPCVIDRLRASNDSLRDELSHAADEIDRLRAGQEVGHG